MSIPLEKVIKILESFQRAGKLYYQDGIVWVVDILDTYKRYPPHILELVKQEINAVPAGAIKTVFSARYSRLFQEGNL